MAAPAKDELPPIEPLHDRWEPNPTPASIEVPGLDTSAPVQDQIEQIEQLITIRLQNIDANFARAHQILATRVLPAVRRYAVNTESVREAARFWVSFYEQAAQVRIPTTDDFSGDHEQQATASDEEAEAENQHRQEDRMRSGTFDPNLTPSESSFAPESAAVSSTPMVHPSAHEQGEDTHELWAASMESPLKRLGEGLKSLGEEDDSVIDYSRQTSRAGQQSIHSEASSTRLPIFSVPEKGKGKSPANLRQNVLTRNVRGREMDRRASPLKVKKTPRKNPYVPPDVRRTDWDGIVDLTKPTTPRRAPGSTAGWSSGEENTPSPKLSPPRSAFAKRIAQVGRTPVREAAARIGRDLIGDAERFRTKHHYDVLDEPTLSATPSSPSLSMYTRRAMGMEDSEQSSSMSQNQSGSRHLSSNASTSTAGALPSVDNMMQQYGLDVHRYEDEGSRPAVADSSFDSLDDTPGRVFAALNALPDDARGDDGRDIDSSFEDSFEEGNTGAPSAAFLMASARQNHALDDSFEGSDRSSDSLDGDDDANAGPAIHPFANAFNVAMEDDGFDDSLDYDNGGGNREEEPTVFGLQQAQRIGGSNGQLQLLGQGMLDDTTALNSHLRTNVVPDTPTPWTVPGQGGSK